MITILEGVDGVGKTSYARWLAETRCWDYGHAGVPTHRTWGEEYINPLHRGQNIVLDRWHVGELVWPPFFNRSSLFKSMREFNMCNKALSVMQARMVYVFRDERGIRETLEARGEDSTIDDVLAAQKIYMLLIEQMRHLPVTIVHSDVLHQRRLQCSFK